MTHDLHRVLAFVAAGALIAAACSSGGDSAATTTAVTTTSAAPDTVPSTEASPSTTTSPASTTTQPDAPAGFAGAPRQLPAFADFAGVALLDGSTPYAGPPTPTSLDEVAMAAHRSELLAQRPDLAALIAANGFAVDANAYGYRYFHDAYESAAYAHGTVFVTTDVAYHVWHQVFDKVLRDTEEQVLVPVLEELLAGLVDAARAQATELAGSESADAAVRVVAYYEAAATLLGVDVGAISDRAAAEVELATAASEATSSPITDVQPCALPDSFVGCVDYTLFRPRGHYTRSDTLERYFRTMSLLGQEAFYVSEPDSLRMGMLATRVLMSDPGLLAGWEQIYDTTAFLVGIADDYTPGDVVEVGAAVLPDWLAPATVLDDAAMAEVADGLRELREVGIDPENASVRVMGARAVLDSFILDQLAWPNVGTEDDRRVNVSPLDLASAFGSPLASELQSASDQSHFLHYDEQMAAMRDLVAGRDDAAQWAGTVYDAWLYALQPQFAPRSAAYPDFMQTDAWAAKALQTGFGSYTELRHDTILYVKQGTAGEGDATIPPFEPRHWVEPDPVAFGRIAAAAQLALDGLTGRDLLSDDSVALMEEAIELVTWLGGIAGDELAGEVTSDADNDRLGLIGGELELLWYETSDMAQDGITIPAPDESAALVADIFRSSFEYLELGTGWIDTIEVIVPDGRGGFQLAQGGVYSYYEFWRPVTELRLTDEEWRALLIDGQQPPRPAWQASFVVGADLSDESRVVQEVS